MVRIQSNLNNFSVLKDLTTLITNLEGVCGFPLNLDKKGILRPQMDGCPKCSGKMILNGYNLTQNNKSQKFGIFPKKGKVCCVKCGYSVTIPKNVLDIWMSIYDELILYECLSLKAKGMSISNITKHIADMSIIEVSSEYIRQKVQKAVCELEKPQPKFKPSGVIVHDEQYVKIKGVEMKRISQIDANNSNVYYDNLHTDRLQETIEEICKKLKGQIGNVRSAVMDGYTGAQKAFMETFSGILIQFCLFHFAKNVKDAYKDTVGYGKGRSILPLQHLIGFFSILNIFFNHDREIYQLRVLQKEMNEHIERINANKKYPTITKKEWIIDLMKKYDQKAIFMLSEIKKARRRTKGIKLTLRTEEEAVLLFTQAKIENVFPKDVEKQIKRLEKDWKNFTHALRDSSIPPTSNAVEQYYALTLNWIDKRNLQSEEDFYTKQKFSLFKRYGISFIKEGIFSNFLETTIVMLLAFGVT